MPVLADTDEVRYQAFNGIEIVRAARWMPEVAASIRHGGAPPRLPWEREGRPEFNRPVFLDLLAKQWLPAITDVNLRLRSEPPARVTVADAAGPAVSGQYDLVMIFEGLHDMSRPVDALRAARAMLREPGCVIVADELVEDEFTAPASIEEQYHYAWSVVACLPAVMGDPDTSATGAVIRPAKLCQYTLQAGFRDVEALSVKAGMLRFYRLTP